MTAVRPNLAALNRTLDQELLALMRGASLECPACGEFVLHKDGAVVCPECGTYARFTIEQATEVADAVGGWRLALRCRECACRWTME